MLGYLETLVSNLCLLSPKSMTEVTSGCWRRCSWKQVLGHNRTDFTAFNLVFLLCRIHLSLFKSSLGKCSHHERNVWIDASCWSRSSRASISEMWWTLKGCTASPGRISSEVLGKRPVCFRPRGKVVCQSRLDVLLEPAAHLVVPVMFSGWRGSLQQQRQSDSPRWRRRASDWTIGLTATVGLTPADK